MCGEVTNVLVPFALAYRPGVGDERLVAAPGGNEQVRVPVAQFGGWRQQLGAPHLYRHSRTRRRGYECSVARLGREEG